MTEINNIDLFNGVVGKIFALLYSNFPLETELDFETIGIDLVDTSDYDKAWNMPEFVESSVHWLANAGYIWLKDPDSFGAKHTAVLSQKGLEVLKAIPESIDSRKTIGEQIISYSKGKLNEALSQAVNIALSQGLKILTGN